MFRKDRDRVDLLTKVAFVGTLRLGDLRPSTTSSTTVGDTPRGSGRGTDAYLHDDVLSAPRRLQGDAEMTAADARPNDEIAAGDCWRQSSL